MGQLWNFGVKAVNLSFLVHISIFIITCHLLFTPALEAKGRKPSRKPHGKPPGNPEQAMKSKISRLRQSSRVTNGNTTFSDSMCLILEEESGDYVEWDFDESGSYSGLVISDRCVITPAYYYVDTSDTPPTQDSQDPASYTCYVPRDGCDTAYHFAQLVLSKSAPLNTSNYQNDIAIWKGLGDISIFPKTIYPDVRIKSPNVISDSANNSGYQTCLLRIGKRRKLEIAQMTQKSMEIGKSICGQYPLFPAPISCDRNGPPARYSDCFLVGWGQRNDFEGVPLPEIQPNRIRVTTLTFPECETARTDNSEDVLYTMNPSSQVCVKTVDGNNGRCDYDYNPVLYCKYWGKTTDGWGQSSGGWGQSSGGWGQGNGGWGQGNGGWGQGSGGWDGFHQGWQNSNNGGGWGKPLFEPQQILAVGQYVYNYGSNCTLDNSATLVLKFGYEGYADLFASCGMSCSDSLPKGYECMEKWDPALGPVYCTPQKIQHNHGWRAEHRRNPTHH